MAAEPEFDTADGDHMVHPAQERGRDQLPSNPLGAVVAGPVMLTVRYSGHRQTSTSWPAVCVWSATARNTSMSVWISPGVDTTPATKFVTPRKSATNSSAGAP